VNCEAVLHGPTDHTHPVRRILIWWAVGAAGAHLVSSGAAEGAVGKQLALAGGTFHKQWLSMQLVSSGVWRAESTFGGQLALLGHTW
jgi:hypothetical protein